MLKVYVGEYGDDYVKEYENFVYDVETVYGKLLLQGTELERKAIREIEQGKWLDSQSYIDRFGYKLYNSELSMGCKIVLTVLNRPELIFNAIEIGRNARDFLLKFCTNGMIYVPSLLITVKTYLGNDRYFNEPIDVEVYGKRFYHVEELNEFIQMPCVGDEYV